MSADEEVERVARAIYDADIGSLRPIGWLDANAVVQGDYRRLARAALAARRPATEAEEAVRRVEALAEALETDAKRADDAEPVSTEGLTRMILSARYCRAIAARIRAALDPS